MQNLQDLQEKIFFESKTILETLSRITTKEELLAKQDLFAEITDRIAFLRILEKNRELFSSASPVIRFEEEDPGSAAPNEIMSPDFAGFDDSTMEEDVIEEEVMFTNELNEIENEEATAETMQSLDDAIEFGMEEAEEEILAEIVTEQTYAERVTQKEKEFLELEERRRKIVEFKKEEVIHPPQNEIFHETDHPHHHSEKKFKLAHIKGLKVVQNLFDEDPLEKIEEEDKAVMHDKNRDSGSILKTNIPTDFMEAEKKKTEFRLDLNDKVAFTKLLFKGNDEELKYTVDKLNSFDNLEDAKQYLSEIYYQKDWKKADEYAQRLWNLVENKFL